MAVVGDSITVISAPGVVAELRGYALYIRAEDGKRIDQLFPSLGRSFAGIPRAVVINLGHQRRAPGTDAPDWVSGFDTVWDLVRGAACVVFVTSARTPTTIGKGVVAADLNRSMAQLAAEHHNVPGRRLERRGARRPEPAREPEPARRRHPPVDEARMALAREPLPDRAARLRHSSELGAAPRGCAQVIE